ncbi:MAG: adenosylcobinamide-phosphate synthase CbiB [Polyangiaceae bacterium]|jgi:adenosylcobinamide-phosphate synthase
MNGATAFAMLAAAVAVDLTLGEPPSIVHPVVWMGRSVAGCERLAPTRGKLAPFAAGAFIAMAIPTVFASAAAWVQYRLRAHAVLGFAIGAVLLKTTFALRALGRAAGVVRDAVQQGRIEDARAGLRALCSRDSSSLEAPDLLAATIESVAENASDSFVAPLFWFALFGLPGAVFYRAANTLDAMIGYHGRYEWLGKTAARLDDALNFVPARITAGLLLAAAWLQGRDARRGARILARDGSQPESPNAGRPMAAMAGVLGVVLAKAGHYRLGDPVEALAPSHVDEGWRLTRLAAALAVLLLTMILEVRYAAIR